MPTERIIGSATVTSRGRITIPKEVRQILNVKGGDKVALILEGSTVRMVNSAVYAMQVLQAEMRGEAEKAGLNTEDDVMALVKEMRGGASGK